MKRKIGLFFLSLWLLFVLIIIITIDVPVYFSENCGFMDFGELLKTNIIPLLSFIALMIGAISYFDFKHQIGGSPELSFKITEIENIDYEHLTFLTTYIIPLVCFQFDVFRYQLVFILILIAIGIIYIRTDLFYANPTLAILKFRIYKVSGEFRGGTIRKAKILITRNKLNKGDNVKYLKLDEKIYYAFKVKEK